MNFKNIQWAVIAVLISVSFSSCAQKGAKNSVKSEGAKVVQTKPIVELINPKALNSKSESIQLIDVRTPKEYADGHIKNAVNINFYDDDFIDQMSKFDKDKEIYIYCKSGGRSGRAASKLKEQGFIKIYDLDGGFMNWEKNNLETVK